MRALPGQAAIERFGWWRAHRWLIGRRISQLAVLALFFSGPVFGYWIIKGNLTSSLTLGVLPLSDPYVALQSMFAGVWPTSTMLIGAAIVLAVYFLIGGRVYCAWVCPVNMVTDAADWLRRRLGIKANTRLKRSARFWVLATTLIVAAATGVIAWELVNPVSMLFRGLLFGLGLTALVIVAIFLFDLLVSRQAWCGHLCPVGAFYSLLGRYSLLRIRATNRTACNDCMDCFAVCPEPQVIREPLKGRDSDVVLSSQCTNCGRCIDVCSEQVFQFGSRFNKKVEAQS